MQQVMLSADAQDLGSGQESMPAQVTGGNLEIAFNVWYLMDGLKALNAAKISDAVEYGDESGGGDAVGGIEDNLFS